MRDYTKTIPAGGSVTVQLTARVMTCKTFSAPCVVQFNGGSELDAKSGSVFDRSPFGGFSNVTIINRNAIPVTCFFYLGETEVSYSPDDNSVTLNKARCFGNLGVPDNTGAVGGLPACDINGHLVITDGMNLLVPGVRNGQRRSSIIIRVASDSAYTLKITGSIGTTFLHMIAKDIIKLDVDDDLIFSGINGPATCTIGQIFNS